MTQFHKAMTLGDCGKLEQTDNQSNKQRWIQYMYVHIVGTIYKTEGIFQGGIAVHQPLTTYYKTTHEIFTDHTLTTPDISSQI